MPFQFSLKTRGFDELKEYFSDLPRNLRGIASEAASDDLIGDGSRGLKRYPGYKHVTRRAAFGRPFQSDKQRRFVMAGIRSGRIDPGYPHRTGNFQRSWHRTGSGVGSRVVGTLPHEDWPNRLAKKIGWREPMDIIMSNLAHAVRHAEAKIAAWIKAKGL